jgi:hypothetical protein
VGKSVAKERPAGESGSGLSVAGDARPMRVVRWMNGRMDEWMGGWVNSGPEKSRSGAGREPVGAGARVRARVWQLRGKCDDASGYRSLTRCNSIDGFLGLLRNTTRGIRRGIIRGRHIESWVNMSLNGSSWPMHSKTRMFRRRKLETLQDQLCI